LVVFFLGICNVGGLDGVATAVDTSFRLDGLDIDAIDDCDDCDVCLCIATVALLGIRSRPDPLISTTTSIKPKTPSLKYF